MSNSGEEITIEWSKLTPKEKRWERFSRWLSPKDVEFVSPEAQEKYILRVQRFIDAIELREPDRVPVYIGFGFLPARHFGLTHQDVMYSHKKFLNTWTRFLDEVNLDDFDTFNADGISPGRAYELLGFKMYKWPGHGTGPNSVMQFLDDEYMKADEYDYFIDDPSDYQMRVFIPRTMAALKPFQNITPFRMVGGPFIPNLAAFGTPEVEAAFKTLVEAGKVVRDWLGASGELNRKLLARGVPPFYAGQPGTPPEAPFDAIGNHHRGTAGIMTDMYRRPEKLLEVLEKVTRIMTRRIAMRTEANGSPIVFMGLHKGADGFMSEQQFTTFYWPFLKRIVQAYIDEGFVPCLFAEGGYNSRLDIVKELPKGQVIWHFDQTDMTQAKKILGDRACLAGNVPTSLLVTGTPADIKSYCRELIMDAGNNGGYILAPGATTNDAKLENFLAVIEAAKEYGEYRS